jgi:type II secretion system protein G
MIKSTSGMQIGFTIVELLIVIVVIAILAAISLVTYNGVQQRARDSQRKSDISYVQKALGLYFIDNDGYPACNGGVYKGVGVGQTCTLSSANLVAALVPKYVSKLPVDPTNQTGTQYQYYYAVGWRQGDDGCAVTNYPSTNYVIAVGLENSAAVCTTSGWFARNDFGLIVGSKN